MVIPLHTSLDSLHIHTYGSRRNLLNTVLEDQNIKYCSIDNVIEIPESTDIVFASGVYEIIHEKILKKARYGFVCFHETPLPEGRGNAPLQWTVLNDKKHLTVTAFQATKGMDAGDIVYQHNTSILRTDTLNELEVKRQQGIQFCLKGILEEMKEGYLVKRPQSGASSTSPKRNPVDSELDYTKPLIELWDQIRICDNASFPAFFKLDGKLILLRYEVIEDNSSKQD